MLCGVTYDRALAHRWAAIQDKDGVEEQSGGTGGLGFDRGSQGEIAAKAGHGKKSLRTGNGKAEGEELQGLGRGGAGLGGQSIAVVVMVVGAGRGPLVKATIT
jgi:hypothetical protein